MPAQIPGPAQAADPDSLARALDVLAEADRALSDALLASPARDLVRALLGSSPHLAELARREPATLLAAIERGFEPALAAVMGELRAASPDLPREATASLLRRAKRRAALVIAAADVAGAWDVPRVTQAISDLAATALHVAAAQVLHEAHARRRLNLPDPGNPCGGSGLIVLGMGKLGASELNYSSDVDLIVLYERAAGVYQGDDIQGAYVRITRDIVRLMEERTADGYVFRTDLRLRPDPAATPMALSTDAASSYYGSLGQNWERAAMIKARAVAGDLAAGQAFLAELRPWIWRRHLDFAAIRDIHAMRRQIFAHKGGEAIAVAGHDVKLGRGGIREIEFFVQTQQLVWGGRDPSLRAPRTLDALEALAAADKIAGDDAAALAFCYRFLRRVEHRLQMILDRQTHRLPETSAELTHLAKFLGYTDGAAFADALLEVLGTVQRIYSAAIEVGPPLATILGGAPEAGGGSLVFTGKADDPDTIATLARMGFGNAAGIAGSVRGWHFGRYRATRTARARELLTELAPALLAALARQREPDAAFARFDAFLARLPAGVQVLSLLRRNPLLLDRLAGLFGAAPALADYVAAHPAVLDGMIAGSDGADPAALLAPAIADARGLEDLLDGMRRVVREREVLVGVAELDGSLSTEAAGRARSALAEAALGTLLPRVEAEFAERQGRVPGGTLCIAALGKLGAREMLYGSDLDLILLYDFEADAAASDGAKPLDPVTYFARLAQRVIAAITVPMGSGTLYDVDMRLRPSGNKGPIATSLAKLTRYHAAESWTWERMALTRARLVAGGSEACARAEAGLRAALCRADAPEKIRADAVTMRRRIAEAYPPDRPLDIKHRAGGLMELEFIAQALLLVAAPGHPGILAADTAGALRNLAAAGVMAPDEATALADIAVRWRSAISVLRLTGAAGSEELPAPTLDALGRVFCATGEVDRSAIAAQMERHAACVRAAFVRHLGPI